MGLNEDTRHDQEMLELRKSVEDLRRENEQLQRREEQFRFLAENSIDAVWQLDDQFRFVYVSRAVKGILGFQPEEIIGRHLFSILTPESSKAVVQGYEKRKELQETGQKWESSTYTVEVIHKEGHRLWAEVTVNPIFNAENRLTGYNGITRDISERRKNEEVIRQYAFRDSLTNLPNRRSFEDVLERIMNQHKRLNEPFAIMFLDVDGLKRVNDMYGHTAGDALLQAVADRLCRLMRKQDFIARLAGDEFIAILPGVGNSSTIQPIVTDLIADFHQTVAVGPEKARIGVSIGVSFFPRDADNDCMLMQCADQAMYKAKKTVGSSYVCYEQTSS